MLSLPSSHSISRFSRCSPAQVRQSDAKSPRSSGPRSKQDNCLAIQQIHSSMSDLPSLPHTPTGRYRHYKGGEYEVVGAARHSETLEPLVVYRPLYNATGLWVRPHAMFFEQVEFAGKWQPRFARIED
jgi:hypothetical protein